MSLKRISSTNSTFSTLSSHSSSKSIPPVLPALPLASALTPLTPKPPASSAPITEGSQLLHSLDERPRSQSIPQSAHSAAHTHTSHSHTARSHTTTHTHKFELEEELSTLRADLQKKDEYVYGLQRNITTLSNMCESSLEQMEQLKLQMAQLTTTNSSLSEENSKFVETEQNNARLQQENEQLQQQVSDLTKQIAEQNNRIAYLTHSNHDLQSSKQDLSLQLAKSHSAQMNAESLLEEMKQRQRADNKAAQLQELQQSCEQYRKQLAEADRQHQQQLDKMKQQARELQKSQNQYAAVQQEIVVLTNDSTRLKKLIATLRSENGDAQTQIAQWKHKCDNFESEIARLNDQLRSLSHLNGADERVREVDRRLADNKLQYELLWSQHQDATYQIAELKQDLAVRQKEMALTRSVANNSTAANVQQLQQLQQAYDALHHSHSQLQQQYQSLHEQCEELSSQLHTSSAALSQERSMANNSSKDKLSLQHELTTLQQDHARLQRDYAQLQQSEGHAQQSIINLQDELVKISESNAKFANDSLKLNKELLELRTLVQTLQNSNKSLQSAHESSTADLTARAQAQLSEQIRSYEQQISRLQQQLLASEARNGELNAMMDATPRLGAADVARLKKQERELHAAIAKLLINEEASEASFTCYCCLNIFERPVTCIPCGHSYCAGCIAKEDSKCVQCKPPLKVTYYSNEMLSELAAKFQFRKTALSALKEMSTFRLPE